MKLIIAGSRNTADAADEVGCALWKFELTYDITELVSGASGNVDLAGEEWARENNIPVKRFPADWDKHRKAAGPIRNREMAEYADALIAVWDGESKGTANMILEMHRQGKPVFVWRVNECVS
jgi:glycerophosphoryl diester phosphodiesterase